jgi:hypothetical protein
MHCTLPAMDLRLQTVIDASGCLDWAESEIDAVNIRNLRFSRHGDPRNDQAQHPRCPR